MSNTMQDALRAAEIGLANLVSYQSTGHTPTIHEFGQARRALDAVRAAMGHRPAAKAEALAQLLGCTVDVAEEFKRWLAAQPAAGAAS